VYAAVIVVSARKASRVGRRLNSRFPDLAPLAPYPIVLAGPSPTALLP
jgi:hypothetical protein